MYFGDFVDGAVVADSGRAEEPRLIIGIPACPQSEFAKNVVVAGNVPARFGAGGDDVANFGRKFGRDPLVGIHKQHPIGLHMAKGDVALGGIVLKFGGVDGGSCLTSEFGRAILAERIQHNHLIRPTHAGDAIANVLRFVQGEDDGREILDFGFWILEGCWWG